MSAFWFEHLGRRRRQPPGLDRRSPTCRPRRRTRAGRADHARAPRRDAAGRVHRARLPHRVGVEGVPGERHHARPAAARRPAGGRPAARAGVHAVDQGRGRRPRREHLLRRGGRPGRRRAAPRPPATSPSRSTERAAAHAEARGIIIADTKFELGLRRRRAGAGRRGADARTRPASGRADEWEPGATPPSFDKQPVRDYLDGLDWDKSPPPPAAARRRRSRRPEPATSRPTSASPAARSPTGPAVGRMTTAAAAPRATMAAVQLLGARRGPPAARHRRPAGRDHRAVAADARLRRRPRRRVGKAIRFTSRPPTRPPPAPRSRSCASGSSPTR